jgi:hypothetical protein
MAGHFVAQCLRVLSGDNAAPDPAAQELLLGGELSEHFW